MTFEGTIRLFTYLTALWAFIVMAFFVNLHTIAIVLFLIAFLLCYFRKRLDLEISSAVWLGLSIFALLLALYGWFQIGERLYSVVYLFLFLEINKLWTAERTRDLLQVYGLTFFQVLAAAVSTASLPFAPALIIYMFLILGSLITVTMRRDAELALVSGKRHPRNQSPDVIRLRAHEKRRFRKIMGTPLLDWRFTRWLTTMLFICLGIGAALFFVIPRLQAQSFLRGFGNSRPTQTVSGFNDIVNFTAASEIQTDSTIVMRAEPLTGFTFQGSYPEMNLLRLRGTSLDLYDGRQWRKSGIGDNYAQRLENTRMVVFNGSPHQLRESYYEMMITLEPNRRGFLFGPDRPAKYELETPHRMRIDEESESLQLDLNGWSVPIKYRVTSYRMPEGGWTNPRTVSSQATSSDGAGMRRFVGSLVKMMLPPEQIEHDRIYLQLPEHPDMDTVRELAAEWTQGLETTAEIAKQIEMNLKSNYEYSLDISFASEYDHLTRFLLEEKRGHCEYFATSMCLMLRSRGVPSRIVNGYASDEWIARSNYFIVRQEHAHSWVEVYFPGAGWITYDPTPQAGIGGHASGNNLFARLSRWLDTLKLYWYDTVIDFDASDQTFLYKMIFGSLERMPSLDAIFSGNLISHVQSSSPLSKKRYMIIGILFVSALVSLLLIRELLRFRRLRYRTKALAHRSSMARDAVRDYLALLAEVEKRRKREPAQTPLEYAQQVVEVSDALADFLPLTQTYYGARFNGTVWTPNDTQRARALLRLLKQEAQNLRVSDDMISRESQTNVQQLN